MLKFNEFSYQKINKISANNDQYLRDKTALQRCNQWLILFACCTFLLAIFVIAINSCYFQYPGNYYFPEHCWYLVFTLLLMYAGFVLQAGKDSQLAHCLLESIYFFFVMLLLALATTAAQFTPFTPIDSNLLAIESALHIHLEALIQWTHSHPGLKKSFDVIYDSLAYQMCYIPLLIIASRQFKLLREYYFLLMVSALIGFSWYYCFPTTAPASMLNSDLFSLAQKATGLKFTQIHQHIPPSTLDGGLVAFPSFHVIWAWFCVHLVRHWRGLYWLLLGYNIILAAACVLLGWHYTLDLIGSICVIMASHALYYFVTRSYVPIRPIMKQTI